MDDQIYWRVEWHDHDILSAPALSTGWAGIDGRPPTTHDGLSCCTSALSLARYWGRWLEEIDRMEAAEPEHDDPRHRAWAEHDDEIWERRHRIPDCRSRVVALVGNRLGTDIDGYPLVRPTSVLTECRLGTLIDFRIDPVRVSLIVRDEGCHRVEARARARLRRTKTMETIK